MLGATLDLFTLTALLPHPQFVISEWMETAQLGNIWTQEHHMGGHTSFQRRINRQRTEFNYTFAHHFLITYIPEHLHFDVTRTKLLFWYRMLFIDLILGTHIQKQNMGGVAPFACFPRSFSGVLELSDHQESLLLISFQVPLHMIGEFVALLLQTSRLRLHNYLAAYALVIVVFHLKYSEALLLLILYS